MKKSSEWKVIFIRLFLASPFSTPGMLVHLGSGLLSCILDFTIQFIHFALLKYLVV